MRKRLFLSLALNMVLLLTAGAALANDEVTHPFSTAAPRGHVRRVVIDIPAGEVRIRNGASDHCAMACLV